jgi:cytochrome P450
MSMSTSTISGRNSRRTRRALSASCARSARSRIPAATQGFWVLTRWADVAEAARDDATFSSARYPADSGLSAIIIPPTPSPVRNVPIELDPPESKLYRSMLNPLLSPKVSEERLRPFIAGLTTYFIDRVIESGEADLITDIASPVPATFTLRWLGLPVDDWERFAFVQHAIVSNTPDSQQMAAVVAGLEWQYGLIQEAIGRKRVEPGDDVISYLVRQEVDGKPISDTAVMEMVTLLIAGGVDTTTSLTGQAIRYLYEHPEQLAHVQGSHKRQQRDRGVPARLLPGDRARADGHETGPDGGPGAAAGRPGPARVVCREP